MGGVWGEEGKGVKETGEGENSEVRSERSEVGF
jgi:hypothetical protein